MEVIRVFDANTPVCVTLVADALESWRYDLPIPTDDTRCLGFILEQSIALHLQQMMADYHIDLSGATDYPNLHVWQAGGPSLALEVKAAPRTTGIGNRVKSPESIVELYPRYDSHWVIAVFYEFSDDRRRLHRFKICVLQMWQYASRTFKDMSAISALGSLDAMLREVTSKTAFEDEDEFLAFVRHMSRHQGTTTQRNAMARQWINSRRRGSAAHDSPRHTEE